MTQTDKPKEENAQKSEKKTDSAVLIAIVGLIGTIVVALLSFQPFINWANAKLNPTPTFPVITTETFTPFATDTPTVTPGILTPTFTETLPPSPTDLPTAAPQTAPETMTAQLTFSSSAGNAPLMVNFNARNSYVTRANLPTLTCIEKNVCSYTWSVRLGGTTIYGPSLGDSAFSYTFQKKGEYVVVVYVCRGDACNFAAASISVK